MKVPKDWQRPVLLTLSSGARAEGGILGADTEKFCESAAGGKTGTYMASITNVLGGMGYFKGAQPS